MASIRVLALSSSRVGNSGYLEKALPEIKSLLGPDPMKIAFVAYASVDGDYDAYLSLVRKGLATLKYDIQLIDSSVIDECDAIMVGGGNTFKLLHDLYDTGYLNRIREKVNGGTPYIGWSAGANITGATIKTTNDMPVIQPQSFDALGLFSFQINPHYYNIKIEGQNGETRDQRLIEFMLLNPSIPVVGLPEGSALCLRDGVLKLTGDVDGIIFVLENGKVVKRIATAGAPISF